MAIELGPPLRRPRCFYCGSVMMPHEMKCDACNAPIRKGQPVQERQFLGSPAELFERRVEQALRRAIRSR